MTVLRLDHGVSLGFDQRDQCAARRDGIHDIKAIAVKAPQILHKYPSGAADVCISYNVQNLYHVKTSFIPCFPSMGSDTLFTEINCTITLYRSQPAARLRHYIAADLNFLSYDGIMYDVAVYHAPQI